MNPVIPVFIASPNDVSEERKIARQAVQGLAPRLARIFGVTLVPLLWEQFAPISSADATHPQRDILKLITPYSIFIGILWKRPGTPIPENGVSGTEAEFDHALRNRNRMTILSYFRKVDDASISSEPERTDLEKVRTVQERLRSANVWAADYADPKEFRKRISGDLMEAALKMILTPEPAQLRHYADFFRFGAVSPRRAKRVLIVYPPITGPGFGDDVAKLDWQRRLLPNVVYEDSKAIQDVEGVLRMLGRDYRTLTTDSPELDLAEPGDRVWVCVPRNVPAVEILESLGNRCRYAYGLKTLDRAPEPERYIAWTGQDGTKLTVRSPLKKYLKLSPRPPRNSAWEPLFGYAYGRDYGVLSRFRVDPGPPAEEGQTYYHYFIGGIRGLGTWGIGWFIDHCASRLPSSATEADSTSANGGDDLQILLEVTYRNYKITNVADVSSKNQDFFDERISDVYVEKAVQDACLLAPALSLATSEM